MKYLVYFLITQCSLVCYSQESCDFLFDSIEVSDGIIISTKATNDSGNGVAVFYKLDFNGQEVWRLEEAVDENQNLSNVKLHLFSDGFMYAILTVPADGEGTKVLKLDVTQGVFIWQSDVYPSDNDSESDIIDYDSNTIFFYHTLRDNNGGTIGGYAVYLLDRQNGSATLIHEVIGDLGTIKSIRMSTDSQGNIYHTNIVREGFGEPFMATLTKINGLNFNDIIWEEEYIGASNSDPSLNDINELFIDDLDQIYAFETGDDVDVFKLNSSDGSEIWKINNIGSDNRLSDIHFRGNHMYVSLAHIYVGANDPSFEIVKIEKEEGVQVWTSAGLQMTILGETFDSNNKEAIYSFDLDNEDNIYATGYYASQNYAPGAWGIMKINGMDGTKMGDITVTTDQVVVDQQSIGLKAYVINNIPTFLGNLEYNNNVSAFTLVQTNTELSHIDYYTNTCGIEFNAPPSAFCTDYTGALDEQGMLLLTPNDIDNGSLDNEGGITLSIDQTDFNCDTLGETLVTLTVTDEIGQTDTCEAIVTIIDNQLPVFTNCPTALITINIAPGEEYVLPTFYEELGLILEDNCTTFIVSQTPEPNALIDPGAYTVEIIGMDTSGNSATCAFEIEIVETLGLGNIDVNDGLSLFPNPTNNEFVVSNKSSQKLYSVEIIDVHGVIVKVLDLSAMSIETKISLNGYASGLYFVRIQSDSAVYYKRVLKN